MLKHGILGLLNYRDFSGYDLMRIFRDSLSFFWEAKTSQIYRELASLKEKGFVSDRLQTREEHPDRKIYSITDKGKEELQSWLETEQFNMIPRNPILMKTFFLGECEDEKNRERFLAFAKECEDYLKRLQVVKNMVDQYLELETKERTRYWEMTLDYEIAHMQILEKWCRDCAAKLEAVSEQ